MQTRFAIGFGGSHCFVPPVGSSPAHLAAVRAVAELQAEDLAMLVDRIDDYAQAADAVGRIDVDAVRTAESLDEMIRVVVLGNSFRLPLLDALVLLAQQHYAQELNVAIGSAQPATSRP